MNPIASISAKPAATVTETDAQKALADKSARERAASEFEAIFLRQMLAGMQKTSKGASGDTKSGGAQGNTVYSSMVVDAMADAITKGGGLGLARTILEAQAKVLEGAAVRPPTEGIKPSAR